MDNVYLYIHKYFVENNKRRKKDRKLKNYCI